MQKSVSINLKQGQKANSLDKFVDWALTVGRVLVIVTELIALAAFLYRFSLDQQLSDLNTKIKDEQQIVSNLKKNEDTYRNLQDRLALASTTSNKSDQRLKVFNDTIGFAPAGLKFNNVTLLLDKIQMNAEASSVTVLSQFVDSLKNYEAFDGISVDNIENKTSTGTISITLSANLKDSYKLNEISN